MKLKWRRVGRLQMAAGCWAFEDWSPDRLRWLVDGVPMDVDPITNRVFLRPPVHWSRPGEREVLQDSPTDVAWDLALAVLWERVGRRIESAWCAQAWQVVDGESVDRLQGLLNLGRVGRVGSGIGLTTCEF